MVTKKIIKDTQCYTLRDGRKTVYHGITNDLERRLMEHKSSGKKFTSCTASNKCTRTSARKQEKEKLESYKRNHGRFPKYNKRK